MLTQNCVIFSCEFMLIIIKLTIFLGKILVWRSVLLLVAIIVLRAQYRFVMVDSDRSHHFATWWDREWVYGNLGRYKDRFRQGFYHFHQVSSVESFIYRVMTKPSSSHYVILWPWKAPRWWRRDFCCLPLAQVGPVKLVWEQWQMCLFQPSIHDPPCLHGRSWHRGGADWQDWRIEPQEEN